MNLNDLMKVDIAHVGDLVRTPGGDLDSLTGLANYKNALFHRLITVPGTLIHRPNYGVGLPSYLNNLSSFSIQTKLAALIKEQFEQDPRTEKVISVAVLNADENPQQTIIQVSVKPVGYSEQPMRFTPFGGSQ